MGDVARRLARLANSVVVVLYRRSGGKVAGKAMGNSPVLLLTVAGRKSGTPHTVPVAYVHRDGAFYLAGAGGSKGADPAWIRNLRRAPSATIEVGRRIMQVSVEVLGGAEGEAAWRDIVVATLPIFGRFERRTGRRAAVARLTPRGDDPA